VKIKMSISLDPELGDAVREAAAEAGMPPSELLRRAAETKLQQDTDARILDTDEELAEAADELGVDWPQAGVSQ
jgi:hypothetical protein